VLPSSIPASQPPLSPFSKGEKGNNHPGLWPPLLKNRRGAGERLGVVLYQLPSLGKEGLGVVCMSAPCRAHHKKGAGQ